ncbi:hypothetical protein ACFLZ0_00075 [Patescibacteria group bacterium]
MSIEIYEKAAKKFKPNKIKILFIAESPPFKKEGEELRYFYFENSRGKDFLFGSIMEVLFPNEYDIFKTNKDKILLLDKFKENGFFLIDACDYPINQHKDRDLFINNDFPKLIQKIKTLIDNDTKIILIKKNIFELLFDKLKSHGFNVINDEHLDFPSCGNQLKFKNKLNNLLACQTKL